MYRLQDGGDKTWRTYFVDRRYHSKTPPAVSTRDYENDGKAHELLLNFNTGSDDLHGKQAHIDLKVNRTNGASRVYHNISRSARWLPHYDQHVPVPLKNPLALNQIRNLEIIDKATGGLNGDTWIMQDLQIQALVNNSLKDIGHAGPKTFRKRDPRLVIPITRVHATAGQIKKLQFTFRAGGNGLHGQHRNLNVEIYFTDGCSNQLESNVNHGEHWKNNSTHSFTVNLNCAVYPRQVNDIVLAAPNENLKMASLQVRAVGDGINRQIISHGYYFFKNHQRRLDLQVNR